MEKIRFQQQQNISLRNQLDEKTVRDNNDVMPFEPLEQNSSSKKSRPSIHQPQQGRNPRERGTRISFTTDVIIILVTVKTNTLVHNSSEKKIKADLEYAEVTPFE